MSKHRIRDRRKRIRKIKRIRRGILSGIAVAGVVTIVFISWSAIAPETDETPRTYRDVEFVPLPVPMTDADQEIVFVPACHGNYRTRIRF